jgi:hypothetical protein
MRHCTEKSMSMMFWSPVSIRLSRGRSVTVPVLRVLPPRTT